MSDSVADTNDRSIATRDAGSDLISRDAASTRCLLRPRRRRDRGEPGSRRRLMPDNPSDLSRKVTQMRTQMAARLAGGVSLVTLMAASQPPRGLLGRVMAAPRDEASVAEAIRSLTDGFTAFKAKHDKEMSEVQSELDGHSTAMATYRLAGPGGGESSRPTDPEYSQAYASWFRTGAGEHEIKAQNTNGGPYAAMSAGDNEAGGYTAPTEWDRRINKSLRSLSPIRRLARVVSTSRNYSTLWNDEAWGSGWVGETAGRPATATPGLKPVTFNHGEIYANPAITQTLLDDADFDIEQWLADEIGETFARQEGIAFLSGDGVNKPRGILTYVPGGASENQHPGGTLGITMSGASGAISNADVLIDFVYSLGAPYRQNATWLMNSTTAAVIAKMKDGDGRYIWREGLVPGQPATLLGYPVEIEEGMPTVVAGSIPIAFGDFRRGYVVNDRTGARLLRDPYTNKPYVHFYTTKRVGGGVDDPRAIRLLKIGAA